MTSIPKKLVYIPNLGFVSFFQVILVSCLITFALTVSTKFIADTTIQPAEATQVSQNQSVDPLIIKHDKIVQYIKNIRPDISNEVVNNLTDAVMQSSWKYGIPIDIQLAIGTRESKFEQYALGAAGELGFFQILARPHVGRVFHMLQTDEIITKNIYDPYTNATLMASILNSCLEQNHHNMKKSLTCYNGGGKSEIYAVETLTVAKKIRQAI